MSAGSSALKIAALVSAPTGNAVTSPPEEAKHAAKTAALTSTSTTAQAIGQSTARGAREYVTLVSTTEFHIRFGIAAVGVSTVSDMYFPADTVIQIALNPRMTHFRAIRNSADGTLHYYLSSD